MEEDKKNIEEKPSAEHHEAHGQRQTAEHPAHEHHTSGHPGAHDEPAHSGGHPSKENKILGHFSKGDLLFIAISLLMLSYTFNYVTTLKQIPSPLYGGDYYNGLGGVMHIIDGGSILDSAQMMGTGAAGGEAPGAIPWVPWLYHLSVAIFSRLTGLAPIAALLDFSIMIEILALAVIYLFVRGLSANEYLPALIALAYFSFGYSPVLKYSYFSAFLMVPAFVLALYLFLKKPEIKSAIIAGALLGLAGLSNSQAFFVGFLAFFAVAAFFLLPKIFDFKARKFTITGEHKNELELYAIIFGIGLLLSLLFWFRPIFIYHGSTPNDIQNITSPDFTQSKYLWEGIIGLLQQAFFPFRSGAGMLLSVIYLAGLYYSYRNREKLECRFALALFAVWLLGILHPLITLPLFHTHLMNFMMAEQIYLPAILFMLVLGALSVMEWLEKKNHAYGTVLIAVLIIISFMAFTDYWKLRNADSLTATGKEPLAAPFTELAGWIRSNTNVNDVFLTTNEDGFGMNALTGRKVVSYRRTHASPYIDMNQRMADQAVMVYGSNDATRNGLLKSYNVKYLLWTNRWVLSEFQFNGEGKLQGFFDPLNVLDKEEYRAYWAANGVRFIEATMPMDPAPRTGVPAYKQIIALPANFSYEPLAPGIYSNFELVKTFSYGGQDVFRIYRIRQ